MKTYIKKNILLAIVFLSALSLLQCQYVKEVIDEINRLPSTEGNENNRNAYSSSSETKNSSSEAQKSSSSEAKKTRKEVP